MSKQHLPADYILDRAAQLGAKLPPGAALYGIPRGGVPAVYAVLAACPGKFRLATAEHNADIFVDDIVDSGATRGHYAHRFPERPFVALVDKAKDCPGTWVVFPWETSNQDQQDDTIVGTLWNRLRAAHGDKAGAACDHVGSVVYGADEAAQLQEEVARRYAYVLDALLIDQRHDPNSIGTARRLAKMALRETMRGRFEPMPEATTFPNTKELDELYTVGPVRIRSLCSHHHCPIEGECWLGVLPTDRLLGLSKFARLADWVFRRPQIQEGATQQLADLLEGLLKPRGLGVLVRARHACMTWRGVEQDQDCAMTTSVVRGVLRENAAARTEFLALVK